MRTIPLHRHERTVSKREFRIDLQSCDQCGGAVKVITYIEDPAVV